MRIKIFQNKLVKAIVLNVFYMILMMVCFEQFATYDDYTMAAQFASAIGEEYVHGHTFVSPLYGKIVVGLNNLMPFLPWFNILFTLLVFVSLTLLTYDMLEKNDTILADIACNLIILFFSYEGYIGTCFTKIAGITAICGIYILLCGRKTIFNMIFALIILSVGILLRNDMMVMALASALVCIAFYYLVTFLKFKKIALKSLFRIGATIVVCVLLYVGLSNEEMLFGEDYPMYKNQLEENSYRSRVNDYPLPDYQTNMEEYQKVDVSENDINILYQWNYDRYKLDKEVYEAIVGMEENGPSFLESVFSWKNICNFFKEYPKNLFQMDVFYCFLIIVLVYIVLCEKKNMKYIVFNASFSVALNFLLMYYLYIRGRYNQHRVDIAIELAIIVGFIFLCNEYVADIQLEKKKLAYIVTIMLTLLVPYTVHDDFWWGVISDDFKQDVRGFYDKTEEDKSHFYLLGYQRGQIDIFMMYSLWDVTKDNYKDKLTNVSVVSNFYQTDYLQEMDIEDVYKEVVNSDKIRFAISERNQEIAQWEEYFSDRYGEEVKLVHVQSCHGKKIYSVMTDENHFENIPLVNSELVIDDLNIIVKKKKMSVLGSVCIKGQDAFGQQVFLRIRDDKTNEMKEYPLLLVADDVVDENEKYSQINTSIKLPKWYSKKDEVLLIVENDGEYYTKQLSVSK